MNSNCPMGSNLDPAAPWNQHTTTQDVEVTICQTFSKNVRVKAELPDDGSINPHDVNWEEIYENEHCRIQDLIFELRNRVENELRLYPNNEHLKNLLKECDDWVEDEYTVIY